MKCLTRLAAITRFVREAPRPLVLVPTMGALHAGHAALVRRARQLAGLKGTVVVSIFVNPTQFGPREDFSRYPRTLKADQALSRKAGAEVILALQSDEMYPADFSTWVDELALTPGLCGASRPGHFRGVTTVVAKLFNLVQPDIAIFGQKDWQQLAVIRRMVRDLNFPIRIVGVPTVRETDGLALSSRNQYLTPAERTVAPQLSAALIAAKRRAAAGEKRAAVLLNETRRALAKIPGGELDYLELVDAETLAPIRRIDRTATLAVAFKFSAARLIDNIQLK